MKLLILCFAALLTFMPSLGKGQSFPRGFYVDFATCTEFAGVGPVDLARASALVPHPFTTLTVGSTGGFVVRATSCRELSVNGGRKVPTNISQIGIEIVPPDGTGDINNFTLLYVSDNLELVLAFQCAGVPALYDPTLTYQFTYDSTGKAGELYVEVASTGLPAYFLTGTEIDPTAPGSEFKANWWYASPHLVVKQASNFPDIAFGVPSVSFHTDRNSELGKLIGGNTDSDFHLFPVRGVYPSAHMEVSVSSK
jgi:hypothetical protein